jgi:hypothetical protein
VVGELTVRRSREWMYNLNGQTNERRAE